MAGKIRPAPIDVGISDTHCKTIAEGLRRATNRPPTC